MKAYDPSKNPEVGDWLRTDERVRIDLVASYHRRAHVRLPNILLHATLLAGALERLPAGPMLEVRVPVAVPSTSDTFRVLWA